MWRVLNAAVCSLKGGVGKTTIVLGLASAALQRGVDCVLVDLDPQANATTTVEPAAGSATVADVLTDPRRSVVARAVRPTSWGAALRVLPGSTRSPAPQDVGRTARFTTERRGSASTSAIVTLPPAGSTVVVAFACGSRSTSTQSTPRCRAAEASPRTIVVLPTPPLRLHTAATNTRHTLPAAPAVRRHQ